MVRYVLKDRITAWKIQHGHYFYVILLLTPTSHYVMVHLVKTVEMELVLK